MANEKRLISYDVLIAHLDSCIEQGKGLFKSVCVAIKCFVEQMPTVDAVEVVHGRWEWDVEQHGDPMYGIDEDYGYRCSECGMWADEWGVDGDIYDEPPTRLHYCPNCGAKMDGDGNA